MIETQPTRCSDVRILAWDTFFPFVRSSRLIPRDVVPSNRFRPQNYPNISYVANTENLFDSQELLELAIISFILVTFTFDIRETL